MFDMLKKADETTAVARVTKVINALYLLVLAILGCLAIFTYLYGPLASKIIITIALTSHFIATLTSGGLQHAMATRFVAWLRKPDKATAEMALAAKEAAWAAEFENAFGLEYPRWHEYVATGKYQSSGFKTIKDMLEAEWPQHQPQADGDLAMAAMWVVKSYKGDGDMHKGLGMHVMYRNWEVAQDTRQIMRGDTARAT